MGSTDNLQKRSPFLASVFENYQRTLPVLPAGLLPDAQLLDKALIALLIMFSQVAEELTPAADHLEQAAAASVVLSVRIEMPGELAYPRREDGHLHLGRSGIALVGPKFVDNLCLFHSFQYHNGRDAYNTTD